MFLNTRLNFLATVNSYIIVQYVEDSKLSVPLDLKNCFNLSTKDACPNFPCNLVKMLIFSFSFTLLLMANASNSKSPTILIHQQQLHLNCNSITFPSTTVLLKRSFFLDILLSRSSISLTTFFAFTVFHIFESRVNFLNEFSFTITNQNSVLIFVVVTSLFRLCIQCYFYLACNGTSQSITAPFSHFTTNISFSGFLP